MNKKQRTQSTIGLIAAILGAILLLLCVLSMVAAKMNALFPVFLIAGTAFTLFSVIFMICVSDNETGKAYRAALIFFAIHALLACVLYALGSVVPAIVVTVLAALTDGAALAYLLALCFAAAGKKNVLVPVIGLALGAGLYFVNPLISAILLMAAAAALFIIAIVCYRKNADVCFWSILAAVVVLVFSVIALIRGDVPGFHFYLHITLMVTAICAVAACPFTAPVRAAVPEEKEEEPEVKSEPVLDKNIAEITLPYEKWIIKKYQGLSAKELMDAPVDALKGLSAGDAELLKDAFGIKTIGDLAKNKFFGWAEEIVAESLK